MANSSRSLNLDRGALLAAAILLLALLAAACKSTTRLPAQTRPAATPTREPQQAAAPVKPSAPAAPTLAGATAAPPGAGPASSDGMALPESGDPGAAMLPSAQGDLDTLQNVNRYRIALEIDPALVQFSGRMRLEYTNREDAALDQLYFRLLPNGGKSYGSGTLTVTTAAVDGAAVEMSAGQDDSSVLALKLAGPLKPGASAQVDLEFSGQVPEDFGGGSEPAGYGIYNYTDGVLALSGWYPILAVYDEDGWNLDPVSAEGDSVYSDTAFYTVDICAPADLVLAATGVETGERQQNGAACRLYVSGPTRDFMLMGSREYQRLSGEADGVAVNAYYSPGHEAAAKKALDVSVKSLQIYAEKFGLYPFKELDVMDAPMRNALGVEFPGIILVGSSLYNEPSRDDFAVATAHEVGHQWWYSVIGNDVFEEPWLDEALTSFTSSLYYEFGLSPEYADGLWDYWQERYNRLLDSGRNDPVAESLAYFEADPAQRSYGTVVYVKGALFFHKLRQEIGDEAFFTALQQYYKTHKYGIAHGPDLLDAFEAAAGRQLDDFYQEWLYAAK